MDAFAVATATGFTMQCLHLRRALRMALSFGIFQALMPVLGYVFAVGFYDVIASFDHWVAWGLLCLIGAKMLYDAVLGDAEDEQCPVEEDARMESLSRLLLLSIATSIDALAVGISLGALGRDILLPALVIGVVTFVLSLVGVLVGMKVGMRYRRSAEILGGFVLIGIGFKVLLEHLLIKSV